MGWDKNSTESFAGKVRAAARRLGEDGNEFSAADLSHASGVRTLDEQKRFHWVIKDLKKAGELVAVHKGIYRLNGEDRQGARRASKKIEVMWRFLRMRRTVSVGDLQEAAGVSEDHARKYMLMLCRRSVVRRLKDGRWQLIATDLIEAPANDEKAEKLRQMRADRKAKLMGQVDCALQRIGQAQLLVSQVKDELQALGDE